MVGGQKVLFNDLSKINDKKYNLKKKNHSFHKSTNPPYPTPQHTQAKSHKPATSFDELLQRGRPLRFFSSGPERNAQRSQYRALTTCKDQKSSNLVHNKTHPIEH